MSSAAGQHRRRSLPQDLEVERQRPVLDVTQVESDRVVLLEIRSTTDLPESGQARAYERSAVGLKRHLRDFMAPKSEQGQFEVMAISAGLG